MHDQEAIRCLKHIHMANRIEDGQLAHVYLSRLAEVLDYECDASFEREVSDAMLQVSPESLVDVEQVWPVIEARVSAVPA